MHNQIKLLIEPDGNIKFVYDDNLRSLLKEGTPKIRRASNVEPVGDKWIADLTPSGGPILGPYEFRADALKAEVEWLRKHNFPETIMLHIKTD